MILRMILLIRLRFMTVNKNNRVRLLLVLFIAGVLLNFSCSKDKNSYISYHRGIESSQQYVYAQQMMTQVFNTYFKSITDSLLMANGKTNIDGAEVIFTDDFEKSIQIRYWPYSAQDGYGHWRKGIIEAKTITGFNEPGAEINFQFTDFTWDRDTILVDTMMMSNLGKTDGKNDQFHLRTNQIEMRYYDSSGVFTFQIDEMIKRLKYPGTFFTNSRDSLEYWGYMSGSTKSDVRFSAVCAEDSAMIQNYTCTWLKGGLINIDTENFEFVSTVRFSEPDTCANLYLVEIDGDPFPYHIDQ